MYYCFYWDVNIKIVANVAIAASAVAAAENETAQAANKNTNSRWTEGICWIRHKVAHCMLELTRRRSFVATIVVVVVVAIVVVFVFVCLYYSLSVRSCNHLAISFSPHSVDRCASLVLDFHPFARTHSHTCAPTSTSNMRRMYAIYLLFTNLHVA